MADREQPYDPYIPSGGQGGAPAQHNGGNQRTAALQAVSDGSYPSDHWYQAQGREQKGLVGKEEVTTSR